MLQITIATQGSLRLIEIDGLSGIYDLERMEQTPHCLNARRLIVNNFKMHRNIVMRMSYSSEYD